MSIQFHSLFDVFCSEVATQATALNEGLEKLQHTQSPQLLETLSQSIRAVKGAAVIVECPIAINLAQTVEAYLIVVQERSLTLDHALLQQGIALLVSLSRLTEEQIGEWEEKERSGITLFQEQAAKVIYSTGDLEQQIVLGGQKGAETREEPPVVAVPFTNGSSQGDGFGFKPLQEEQLQEQHLSENETAIEVGDTSMLELFRLEVDAQTAILSEGLLNLESQPDSPQALEALMRAAHSVKGAARIVAIDLAVNLAHVMEDCFVAAQNHKITLGSDEIDVLLRGVDALLNISQVEPNQLSARLTEQARSITALQQEIEAILTPGVKAAPKKVEVVQPEKPVIEKSPQPEPIASSAEQERVVRVNAENLNRIMGLAGESLIEANWLKPYADSLMVLKKRQAELSKVLEQLQQSIREEKGQDYLMTARKKEQECREILSDRLHELELFAQRTANLSDRLYREVIASHMRPFADGVQGFPRMIRDLAKKLDKPVKLEIIGKATPVDRDILKKLEAPLTHILRNSVDHGIESKEERLTAGKPVEGSLRVEAMHRGGMLSITISDDGKGIDVERLRQKVIQKNLATPEMAAQLSDSELLEFLFLPGFSTAAQVTEISGRGVGLDIAKSMAQEVGGTVRVHSQLGKGTSFHFQLPLTLSVVRTLLVEVSGEPYAFPLARIEQIVMVPKTEISSIEHRQYFTMDNKNIGLIMAHQVLELSEPPARYNTLSVVVISDGNNAYGLVVDRFLGEHDLVVRPLDPRLGKVQDISAAALMGDGSPILIVDVADLMGSIDGLLNSHRLAQVGTSTKSNSIKTRKSILVVDDSITVRETERKLLQNRGYHVDVAVDGVDGWMALCKNDYDLVVSDVDMPRMNGIELVSKIKSHNQFNTIPVIIVSYRDREEDRIRGLQVGADYYLTKSSFHDDHLVNAVRDLIGAEL